MDNVLTAFLSYIDTLHDFCGNRASDFITKDIEWYMVI